MDPATVTALVGVFKELGVAAVIIIYFIMRDNKRTAMDAVRQEDDKKVIQKLDSRVQELNGKIEELLVHEIRNSRDAMLAVKDSVDKQTEVVDRNGKEQIAVITRNTQVMESCITHRTRSQH